MDTYEKILFYCQQYQRNYRRPPTVREIGKFVGIVNATVMYHLTRAVNNKDMRMIGPAGQSRNYEVIEHAATRQTKTDH